MAVKKIEFLEKGTRSRDGKKVTISFVIAPLLIMASIFIASGVYIAKVHDATVEKCQIEKGRTFVDVLENADKNPDDYAKNECLKSGIAATSFAQEIMFFDIRFFLISLMVFLLLLVFGNKHLSKTIKWGKAILFTAFFALIFITINLILGNVGLFNLYLSPLYVLILAWLSMKIISFDFWGSVFFSVFILLINSIISIFLF
ncbi:MAG: hypothetical protein UY41_C0055G0004 [Candidatus Moranbacteria bacterium GW2011_GWE1_49_15]|nr:MAG: hypothetical protein UX75_C0055G0004 [Candidatus Moranbacteria bacterium GW2011_GWE2_47_10]KKW05341.1 MAG: hypothetical protein UY41_C0055G0004 [Candidatus Moranbacteria bacterium GW2011_GWE1_49_15]HBP00890.1 hypothetical protein [Candidatus Moranbacteria bacterium]